MKRIVIATALVASVFANALATQAAPAKMERFDAAKLFEDIANRGGG